MNNVLQAKDNQNNNPKLKFNNVSKIFRSRLNQLSALEDISLEVESNDLVCILGSSGCGKSTLLNIVAGLDSCSSGKIELDGRKIDGPHFTRCLVFQDPCLYPWRNVSENVALGLDIRGYRMQKKAMVSKYIDLVGLTGFEKWMPSKLSGGMAQRVALARALVNNPEVLLCDEPFGALDAITRTKMQDELLRIWKDEKCTILFVTHDIDEAIYLGTKIVIMTPRPGKIKDVFEVPFTHPRIRTSREFLAFRAVVSRAFNAT